MQFLVVCGGAGHGLIGHVPNMDGELLIDVYSENQRVIDELGRIPHNFHRVDLDREICAQSGHALINLFLNRLVKTDNLFPEQPQRYLIRDLHKYYFGHKNFSDGVHQSPTLGGFLIRHPQVSRLLDASIARMVQNAERQALVDQDVTVWIVSSTVGGTGEGINRYVAERFLDYFAGNNHYHNIGIVFLRIGPATYRSCDTNDIDLNSFYAIAHDKAFITKMRNKYGMGSSVAHIYLDLPDVGSGRLAAPARSKMIALTCGQMMHQWNDFYNVEPGVFRAGLWMDIIPQERKYVDALKALQKQLSAVVNEEIEQASNTFPEPMYWQEEGLFEPDADILNKWLTVCEDFLQPTTIPDFFEEFKKTLERIIKTAELIFELDSARNDYQLQVPNPNYYLGNNNISLRDFERTETNRKTYRSLELALWLKKCASHQLGIDLGGCEILDGGLISRIIEISRSIRKIQKNILKHPSLKKNEISMILPSFLSAVFEAYLWINCLSRSQRIFDENRRNIEALLTKVNIELNALNVPDEWANSYITIRDLDEQCEEFHNRTWLDALYDNVKGDLPEIYFKDIVLSGVQGLTVFGLRKILRVDENTPFEVLLDRLTNGFDFYPESGDQQFEWQWWQGMPMPNLPNRFSYRFLPSVEEKVTAFLGNGNENVGFFYDNPKTFGLNLGLLEGGHLDGDASETYRFHIEPFIAAVKGCLSEWKFSFDRFTGRYRVMTANNLDEPISRDFLSFIGLEQEEIEKIGYYSQLI
jgi:hypothetical protein